MVEEVDYSDYMDVSKGKLEYKVVVLTVGIIIFYGMPFIINGFLKTWYS